MKTHEFNLVSGPICVVREFTGKHQRILTEQKKKKLGMNLNEVLVDIVVRIGSRESFDVEFFDKVILDADKKKILTQARQFSMEFDPTFKFNFEYTDSDEKPQKYVHEEDLSEGFPEEPYKEFQTVEKKAEAEGEAPTKELEFLPWTENEYADVEKHKEYDIVLPSGDKCRLRLLDAAGVNYGMAIKKSERSSHTPVMMRFPRILSKTKAGAELPIQANLDKLSWKDIEAIRTAIKEHEGKVHTEIRFEHPEAESRSEREKHITVDVTGELAFFFPSEAI